MNHHTSAKKHLFIKLLGILCVVVTSAQRADAADRPNFVWLVSEDNSKHFVQLFDPAGAPMPNVEALAEHGLIFEHAFSNAPVCSVARTTLATSCYAPRIGTQYHRRAEPAGLPKGVRMTPAILRQNGYYTVNNSKTDYNAIDSDVWHNSSKKATWRNRDKDQPFFYMQSFGTTHESSLHFSRKAMNNSPTKTDPKSVTLQPIHPDTPTFRYTYARYHDRHAQVDTQIGKVIEQLKTDGLLEDTFIFYFGDHGGVLPGSKGYAWERGLHVPLVVRVPKNFQHLLGEGFDADYPLRVEGFVEFVDFGPTLLKLAGITSPDGIDGQAFLGEGIDLQAVNERDEAFGYADRFDEKYDMVRTLRKGDYKYVRNYQPFNIDGLYNVYRYRNLAYQEWRQLYTQGELNADQAQFFEPRPAEQLFNIADDPYELTDLAGDPDHAEILNDLRMRLGDRVRGMPDLSFIPEPAMIQEAAPDFAEMGRQERKAISDIIDLADLQLKTYQEAAPGIKRALAGDEPERYWGLIVASTFAKESAAFIPTAREIAQSDAHAIIRARAIEFLSLSGAEADYGSLLNNALDRCDTPMHSLLVLNTAALIKDTNPGFTFSPRVQTEHTQNRWVKNRVDYFK